MELGAAFCFGGFNWRTILLRVESNVSRRCLTATSLALLVLAPATEAFAQQAPNAGTLLRQQPAPPPPPPPSAQPFAVAPPSAPTTAAGPRVLVKAVRITGSKLIPADELAAQLRPLIGKEHTLADLQRAATALVGYYIRKGYIAQVYLPPQQVQDGVVEFRVVEGFRGPVKVDDKGKRVDADRVKRFIDARVAAGAPLAVVALADAINILGEQPGVQASIVLATGKDPGEVDIAVEAADKPLLAYTVGVNNEGSLGTGAVQGTAGMTVANPTGRFDQVSLLANVAQGSGYVRAAYDIAVGDRGLRLGVDASGLAYKLVQPSLSALDGSGSAETAGFTAYYPLADRTPFRLAVTGSFDGEAFLDRTLVGVTSNRVLAVASIGVSGSRVQAGGLFAGSQSFGAAVVGGDVSQNNSAALAADQAGLRTQGGFTKITWSLGWTRPLIAGWAFSGVARGQFADKNLDSSQRFSLGGPSGVRGYPVAEGTGDEGWIASLNLAHPITRAWTFSGFFDGGGIDLDHTPLPGGGINGYTLASAGVTLDWQVTKQARIDAVAATPVGDNPGAQANGTNSDGSRRTARFWLSLNAAF